MSVFMIYGAASGARCAPPSFPGKRRDKAALLKRLRSCHKAATAAGTESTEERGYGEERTKDRLDRHGPHGIPHGGTPAEGRPRPLHLEPHALQGRAAR